MPVNDVTDAINSKKGEGRVKDDSEVDRRN